MQFSCSLWRAAKVTLFDSPGVGGSQGFFIVPASRPVGGETSIGYGLIELWITVDSGGISNRLF